jgi:hypothetical protein
MSPWIGCTGRSSSKLNEPNWMRYWNTSVIQLKVRWFTASKTT